MSHVFLCLWLAQSNVSYTYRGTHETLYTPWNTYTHKLHARDIHAYKQTCKHANVQIYVQIHLYSYKHTNKHTFSEVLTHSHARMHYVRTPTLRKIASYIYIRWHCIIIYNYRDGLTGADGWRQQLACPLQHHPPQVPLRARGLQPPIKRSWKRI